MVRPYKEPSYRAFHKLPYSKNYDHFIYSLSLFAKKRSKLKVVKSAAFQVTCATKQIAVHFVTRQI